MSWKMTNFFFERYGPAIFRGLHKWCCERILTRFRLFRGKKIFFLKTCFFWHFLHIRGHRFLEKWPTSFLREVRGLHKWCCERILRCFRSFRGKNRPEICRGLHKWCCEQILRHLRLFRAKKKIFKNLKFFDFFAYPGSQISWKMTNVFFARYRPEICRGLHKWCCERILRRFGSFRAKKKFFEGSQFFDFFCITGVTDFLKNDQLLFWEIRACNFSWTTQMVLRTNFKPL